MGNVYEEFFKTNPNIVFESREFFGDAMVIEHSSSWINFIKNIFDESEEKFSFYNFTMKNYN